MRALYRPGAGVLGGAGADLSVGCSVDPAAFARVALRVGRVKASTDVVAVSSWRSIASMRERFGALVPDSALCRFKFDAML